MDTDPHPGMAAQATPDELYTRTPPWDIGRPQPAFLTLAEAGAVRGQVLDVGCGTGEHTLMAAALGLPATGVDLASTALHAAEEKARQRGLTARFLRHDALRLAALGDTFDTVLDCGLFHLFTGADRASYVESLRSVLSPDGRYFMLGLREQPGGWQRHTLTRHDISSAFTTGWRIETIEPATMAGTLGPDGLPAWFVTAIRTKDATC